MITLRAYIPKDLSKELGGPDDVHYETVRTRIKSEKHVEIVFFTRGKKQEKKTMYLSFDDSKKLEKALEIYKDLMEGKIKIINI